MLCSGRRPASQKSLPLCVLCGRGHIGCVCLMLPAVLVGGMQPLHAVWVSSRVEMKDLFRKMKLELSNSSFFRCSSKLLWIADVQSPWCLGQWELLLFFLYSSLCLASPDCLVWLVLVGQRCWYRAGRKTPIPVSQRWDFYLWNMFGDQPGCQARVLVSLPISVCVPALWILSLICVWWRVTQL